MTHARGSLPAGLVLALTAAGTAWVSMLAWGSFTEADERHLGPLLVIGAAIAVTGAVTRWWRWPRAIVVLTQTVLAAAVGLMLLTGSPLPTAGARAEATERFRAAFDTAQGYAAPVPADAPSLAPLLILCGLAVMLVVDVLACTLSRPPLAGLPLLTVYSVPISVLGGGVPAWVFVTTAMAFLLLLFVQGSAQINHWGRPIAGAHETSDLADPRPPARSGAAGPTAVAIGTTATAMAVAVPVLIPTLDLDVFAFGAGGGSGAEVKIHNPTADLLRDINRGRDVPLVTVTTQDPRPDYLRVATLNRFGSQEWSPGNRDIPASNVPEGEMPPPVGVSPDLERSAYDYRVAIDEAFESKWLPTQFPVTAITAEGDWRYDERTMDFFRWDESLDTGGMQYEMTGVELDFDAEELPVAPSSTTQVDDEFLAVPEDLPEVVDRLAREVTAPAPTRFEKAVALQNWFRSEFDYNLERSPVRGSGYDALRRFLEDGPDGREGYCEQFAASMAAMARTLGIPARVAIGFLIPDRVDRGVWQYSAHDLHAWPELYFDGFGWVRFEPTPGVRAPRVPSYTDLQDGIASGGQEPTGGPGADASARPPEIADPRLPPEQQPGASDESSESGGFPWALLVVLVGVVAVLMAANFPRLARRRLRESRLDGGPEDAWAELRDTAVDLRLGWPPGRTPRETRDRLVELFGVPGEADIGLPPQHGADINPEAERAVDRIVADLELLRYSKTHQPQLPSLRAEIQCCLEALEAGVAAKTRRRAHWFPVSVLSRMLGRRRTITSATESTPSGELIEHVG